MKCDECSEILVDYISGELSPELNSTVKNHLSDCSKCSNEIEEYRQIQMSSQKETMPQVSSEVLKRLSKAARHDIKKAKPPFWKKWSYSPILVPTLTTAIALSVWLYYGDEAANLGSVQNEQAVLSMKADPGAPQPEYGDSFADAGIKKENSFDPAQKNEVISSPVHDKLSEESQRVTADPSPLSPSEPKVYSGAELEEAEPDVFETQEQTRQGHAKIMKGPQYPELSDVPEAFNIKEKKELGLAKSNMQREQFQMGSQKTVYDDCEDSIRINESIINSSDSISLPEQKESFKVLAHCYEQKGDYDKAISNYINLEKIAPEESSFANSRIQEIRNKIGTEQNQQKKLSTPRPAN